MKFNSRITNLTASQKLQKIAEALNIKNPKVVDLSQGKGMPTTLTECKITCTAQEKDYYTYYFIVKHPGRTLIFCNSIGCVRRLVTILSLLNCNVVALHSSLHQRQRLKNLDKFKGNDNCILIATDVAARGLDISNIQHVIHYQTPRTSESYVHRSGRTARASNEGITVLLVEPNEIQQYLRLCRTLGKTEDLPLFPIQENYLDAVKKRVNLAREIDKLEFKVKKSNSSTGWLQKAAEEMDIILDDDLQKDPDEYDDSNNQKKAATVKRKLLNALLEKPIFPRSFSGKYPLSFEDPEVLLNQGAREENAVEVMRNAIENNAVKHTIKTKRLFKSKIPKSDDINLNSFLKQKNSQSKPNFKNGNNRKRKNRKR
ncbi:rna helicase [Holotrichia oblita]|uniref:Rna helicase n=1 Tax=Holotrichia oblita TaxID=644536 RepID=A0ACB9TRZ0_HOLOL|nr:rna helicase [Holotrichia oblita]